MGNSAICNGVTDVDLASDPLWPSSWPQPPPPHQRRLRIRDLRKPGPRACCISCSPPTTRRQLHQRSERPCTPSAFTSQRVDNARWLPTAAWNFRQLSRAYDLRKLRGNQLVEKPARTGSGASRAHHRRDQVIAPIFAGIRSPRMGRTQGRDPHRPRLRTVPRPRADPPRPPGPHDPGAASRLRNPNPHGPNRQRTLDRESSRSSARTSARA